MSNKEDFEKQLTVLKSNQEFLEWILEKEQELRKELLCFFKTEVKEIENSLTTSSPGPDASAVVPKLLQLAVDTYIKQWQ